MSVTVQMKTDVPTRVVAGTGHTLLFQPDVPRPVPKPLVQLCRSHGCFIVDEAGAQVDGATKEDTARDQLIDELVDICKTLVASGRSEAFTGNGEPRVPEVRKYTSKSFDRQDLKLAWAKMLQTGESLEPRTGEPLEPRTGEPLEPRNSESAEGSAAIGVDDGTDLDDFSNDE